MFRKGNGDIAFAILLPVDPRKPRAVDAWEHHDILWFRKALLRRKWPLLGIGRRLPGTTGPVVGVEGNKFLEKNYY
jgi:hypothetical protein